MNTMRERMMRDQLEEMQSLHHHMNYLLEQAGRGGGYGGASSSASSTRNADNSSGGHAPRVWAPEVDVVETESEIVLHAELPGMKKEDIDIQLTGDTLTLRGARQCQAPQRGENFHRIERQHGAFGRSFEIETPIDAASVSASYENGVLTVRLPKQQTAKSRRIEIQVK